MWALDIEPNEEERREKLSQDFDTPFSPPQDIPALIPVDDPVLDDPVDEHQYYDEGRAGAAEATSFEGDDNLERDYLERIG